MYAEEVDSNRVFNHLRIRKNISRRPGARCPPRSRMLLEPEFEAPTDEPSATIAGRLPGYARRWRDPSAWGRTA